VSNGTTWQIEIRHPGLNKYRLVTGRDKYVVEQKAAAQMAAWDEMWARRVAAEKRANERLARQMDKQGKLALAEERTAEAEAAIAALGGLLNHTLGVDDRVDWDSLKTTAAFPKKKPVAPSPMKMRREPKESDFEPAIGKIDSLLSGRKQRKREEARARFETDHAAWMTEREAVQAQVNKAAADHRRELQAWEEEKAGYIAAQNEANAEIDRRQAEYEAMDAGAILEYCDLVLSSSEYPDYFPQEFGLDYSSTNKTLLVDYFLPSLEEMPRLKEVKYVQSRDCFTDKNLPETAVAKLYDEVVYQLALRTIHELYEADVVNGLGSVVFNGWVRSVDKGTGKEVTACIISLQASREAFLEIDLERVEPKACFKNLKGVGSARLHTLTPVAPLMTVSREDKRFVSSYAVADDIDSSVNLAAMDWEDFEHLIRELFEKEFARGGGEVRVTQASRDGGVDAVAFDPDPIRGGKIVIQAKRYTNVVGVSAVRDLYGTVMNEGATKGILVTTADYGPDAYDFAKGKPLTLLNGGNLLHLLAKHGHEAKIDLKEAKQILADEDRR